jgi:RNA polymerase sigma factor (sigma-70 family)
MVTRREQADIENFFARLAPDDRARTADNGYYEILNVLEKFFRWNGHQDAEDLAMETISRVVNNFSDPTKISPDSIESPKAYLFGIAKHINYEAIRRKIKDKTLKEEGASEPLSYLFDPFTYHLIVDSSDRIDSVLTLRSALDSLSPYERELLHAYYLDDLTSKELAKKYGLSQAALRMTIFRIKRKIKQLWEKA